RTKPASSSQHGQVEAMGLGVAVYAVAVVEEFSHDRADKHGANGCQERPPLWEGIPCGEGCPAHPRSRQRFSVFANRAGEAPRLEHFHRWVPRIDNLFAWIMQEGKQLTKKLFTSSRATAARISAVSFGPRA